MTELFLDSECFPNYYLVTFYAVGGKSKSFDMWPGKPLDYDGIWRFLNDPDVELVTFNGTDYDLCLLALALSGADCAYLKQVSNYIIENGTRVWEFEKTFGVLRLDVNHIDLIEVAPGMVSLKIYGGRLHMPRLQDMPYHHESEVTPEMRPVIKLYCRNDCATTCGLYYALKAQIDLRRIMSNELGTDVRSKSDAQIAEVVLKTAAIRQHGVTPRKVPLAYTSFKYTPPSYIGFITTELQGLLDVVSTAKFKIKDDTGHVEMPEAIDTYPTSVNGRRYKVGIGGLHSQEQEQTIRCADTHELEDIDVVSYYPNLMLNMGMYPEAIGPAFIDAYRGILDERVAAKRAKDKVKDSVLKITLNGTFGKTSSKWSILYNPKFLIQTTITGQLSILMLIEALEHYGIPVVSANTDGIVVYYPKRDTQKVTKIVGAWEKRCNLQTDRTRYDSIFARDVNNYIALKPDGSVKAKGVYAPPSLAKNPQNEICVEAVVQFLTNGTDIAQTIRGSQDIRKFLTLRTVKGGAFKEGYELGKAIRWYYALGVTGTITYASNGNDVPRTEGAKPLMELPCEFPKDVDYVWYINEANAILMDLGVTQRPPKVKLPRKNSKAWKAMVAEGLITV
jgi:hypothetical protein